MTSRLIVIVPRIALALAFPLFTAPSGAQTGNPAGQPAQTPERAPGLAAPLAANDADRLFVQQASIGGKAEVELGRMAESRGSADGIKAFGRRMATDHGDANAKLAAVARNARVPVPDALDDDHRVMVEDLGRRRGADFDAVYARGQVAGHQRTAQLLEWEIGAGQNEALKTYAKQALPLVLDHLEHAQRLVAEVGAMQGGGTQAR
jgi:putative membrane protein